MKDLDSRYVPGTWLGRRWGHHTHIIWDGEKAVEAYAVQKRPKEERWNKQILENITATPWNWTPTTRERLQVEVIPGGGGEPRLPSELPEDYTVIPPPYAH